MSVYLIFFFFFALRVEDGEMDYFSESFQLEVEAVDIPIRIRIGVRVCGTKNENLLHLYDFV